MTTAHRFWLGKSEPSLYSIDDLARDGRTGWEGVRNYTARNFLRDDLKLGDRLLFYHSSCPETGVAGIAEVCREAYPDPTAFDPTHPYFDEKSKPETPTWFRVDVSFVEKFPRVVTLETLKTTPGLEAMLVVRKGQRLSVMPVTPEEFDIVVALGRR
ncbi:MAG: EVE domain-containing protein [Thermoanaerobaculia bacterium]|nr:EVE domain-containing protein [Thermoanaerobaculia bacterium]